MSRIRGLSGLAGGFASIADGFASIGEAFLPHDEQKRRWEARRAAHRKRLQDESNRRLAEAGLPPIDLTPPKTDAEAFARDRAALSADMDRVLSGMRRPTPPGKP